MSTSSLCSPDDFDAFEILQIAYNKSAKYEEMKEEARDYRREVLEKAFMDSLLNHIENEIGKQRKILDKEIQNQKTKDAKKRTLESNITCDPSKKKARYFEDAKIPSASIN